MAKANQYARHPWDAWFGTKKIGKVSLKVINNIKEARRKRWRKLRYKMNKRKHKAPRGFKMAKKDRYNPNKTNEQIERGFEIAKKWRK